MPNSLKIPVLKEERFFRKTGETYNSITFISSLFDTIDAIALLGYLAGVIIVLFILPLLG